MESEGVKRKLTTILAADVEGSWFLGERIYKCGAAF